MSGRARRKTGRLPSTSPSEIHLIATIYAEEAAQLDDVQQRALADGRAWTLLGTREGYSFPDDIVHFGYRDNIMQPRFEGIHDPQRHADGQPMAPLGTVLLGHPTNLEGLLWRVPEPKALGHNGTFNAFRVLKQDVAGFEKYLDQAASYLLTHPQVDEVLPPGAEAENLPGPLDRTPVASWRLARGRRRQPVRPMARWHAAGPLGGRA